MDVKCTRSEKPLTRLNIKLNGWQIVINTRAITNWRIFSHLFAASIRKSLQFERNKVLFMSSANRNFIRVFWDQFLNDQSTKFFIKIVPSISVRKWGCENAGQTLPCKWCDRINSKNWNAVRFEDFLTSHWYCKFQLLYTSRSYLDKFQKFALNQKYLN